MKLAELKGVDDKVGLEGQRLTEARVRGPGVSQAWRWPGVLPGEQGGSKRSKVSSLAGVAGRVREVGWDVARTPRR